MYLFIYTHHRQAQGMPGMRSHALINLKKCRIGKSVCLFSDFRVEQDTTYKKSFLIHDT